MELTVQCPPQPTTKQLLVVSGTHEPVRVGLVDDWTVLAKLFTLPVALTAVLESSGTRDAGMTPMHAPLVLAGELTTTLDAVDALDDSRTTQEGGESGLLLLRGGRVLLGCRRGSLLAVCGQRKLWAGSDMLGASHGAGPVEPVRVLADHADLLGTLDAVVPVTLCAVWRWQLSSLVAALCRPGPCELHWGTVLPLV
jgi:hypothetical protein